MRTSARDSLADRLALAAGPAAGLLAVLFAGAQGVPAPAALVAGLTALVAVWWIFEPVPIPLTSLLPLALLPLAGIATPSEVAEAYGNPLILLLLGGFMLSQGLAKSGVHRRIALNLVKAVGGRGGRSLVAGFMLAAALLSMWISNTATCLMLLPIALAALERCDDARLRVAVLLGIAYASSVGGMATPIGTPPNLIFMEVYRATTGIELGFADYLRKALPVVVLLVPLIALWLTRGLGRGQALELPEPGRWRPEEQRALGVFALVALAWVTRTEPSGGWSAWFGLPTANDATVALLGCVLMGIVPDGRGGRLLDWDHASRIPWGILLLFGGGIALATGFANSGLSVVLGRLPGEGFAELPLPVAVAAVCLTVTFLTEVTSNTATASLLMPILAAVAVSAGHDPGVLMFACALSASCAFMLPVATGPNAVVFGSGHFSIATMAREGLLINLAGAAVITLVVSLMAA